MAEQHTPGATTRNGLALFWDVLMVARMLVPHIINAIVSRERFAFRNSSCLRLRQAASAKHRPPRRQAVVVDGRRWDKESPLRVGDIDIHAFANDVRMDSELEPIDDRSSAHVRRWEGELVVRTNGITHIRATWCGTNGSVDVVMFDLDDESITDATLREIQQAIADEFGCPEDTFGVERVMHEDPWRTHPPDAIAA